MAEEVKIEGNPDSVASSTRQRKKRKWDQPAESVIAAATSTPGLVPLSNVALAGITLPGIFPSLVGVYPTTTSTASAHISLAFPTVQQNAAAIVQKINQDLAAKGLVPPTKIQDELIAREIVINDAEPGVRYRLTKRQTQEEIQLKTGAVVITRGKYKPPNGPSDHEKPLYLHISAGSHLKDTAERIRAVDQAAALVDEMLKQGRQVLGSSSAGQLGTSSPVSAVVFVDFEADSSLDLINRIRGPNDQYINHIMNETGATVLLKGGACEGSCSEEIPQPLHLLISAEHTKSLDDARSLAEHLLETIRSEVVGPRHPYFPPPVSYNLQQPLPQIASSLEPRNAQFVSLPQQSSVAIPGVQSASANSASLPGLDVNVRLGSLKNYSAVPPPKQLQTADVGAGKDTIPPDTQQTSEASLGSSFDATALLSTSTALSVSTPLTTFLGSSTIYAAAPANQLYAQQTYGIYPQASRGSETYPSYSAYSGLYPQATPLQQVALALQRPALNQGSVQFYGLHPESLKSPMNTLTEAQSEKQERQRRKFQEGPSVKREPLIDQNKQGELRQTAANQLKPPPRSILAPFPGGMPPPPPPGSMPPPPPQTKSTTGLVLPSTVSASTRASASTMKTPQAEMAGIKLVEYGEDEDEDEGDDNAKNELSGCDGKDAMPYANGKPFWAV